MGLIGKIVFAKLATRATRRLQRAAAARAAAAPAARAASGQYIPAGAVAPASRGGALIDSAARFYQQNPKLATALGTAVVAALAAGLSRRRH